MKFKPPLHLAICALSFALLSPVNGEVTRGAELDPSKGAEQVGGNWSAALEKSQPENSIADLSKDLSPEARILNEHLANFDKPGQIPDAKKASAKTAAQPGVAAPGAKAVADPPDDWGSEWANRIRDFIRPIHKGVVNSEVVQVVRELDAAIPKKQETDGAPPIVAPLILEPVGPLTSEEQRQRDKLAASMAMEQLFNDLKPYAYSLLTLMVLGYLGVTVWRFLMWKQNKPGKRIRHSRTNQQSRSRSAAGAGQDHGNNEGPSSRSGALTSRAAPLTSRAAPLSSRAAPLQGDTQNDRLSL